MTLWTGPLLPLAALVWPLLLGALCGVPALRERAVRLLPLGPLPALWLALAGSTGETTAPGLLLGVTLGLDAGRQLLLGLAAVLWLAAGLAAQPMAGRPRTAPFAGFWCLTLAGNLGVFLAHDVVTFYVAFAAVSLAAWFLVVQDRTDAALRAGRVYIVMALAGEICLLVGLLVGAHAAASMQIAPVRAALAEAPVALALLVAGFGIKTGLVPLHVWLPLAHPAAPVPASAVLSGAIVKAGLAGFLLFLPAEVPALVGLGLAGAFGAALWGLTQANPKAVLAYSTVSQMGLVAVLAGAGGAAREAAAYFAAHHGLAKGALFLLVGAMAAAATPRARGLCLALGAGVAASVAGAPLTGGALAKAAAKPGLGAALSLALSLSSATTALLLAWFLHRLARLAPPDDPAESPGARALWPAAQGVLAVAVPWALWPASGGPRADLFEAGALVSAAWPLALAAPAAALLIRRPLREHPPGDLLRLLARARPVLRPGPVAPPTLPDPRPLVGRALGAVARAERRLARWPVAGALLPALSLGLLALLLAP
jgi:formate hydrogenlyase subunit 3/multisubunit Na+/H+ antiporter MnhD subunit